MHNKQINKQEDKYFRILQILSKQPNITQRELAFKLGLSVSGLNYCLKALIAKGFVKIENFKNNNNKFGYLYILTPTGILEKTKLTTNFLKRKIKEFELLKKEIDNIENEKNN